MTPEVSPPARHYHAMDHDPSTDRVVLYGGTHGPFLGEIPYDDTWAYDYDSNTWTELAPKTSPGARGWHAMAYSGTDRRLVLFGGGPDRQSYTAETWLFDPATEAWTQYLP